jgi:arginyl-tRNA synthetase
MKSREGTAVDADNLLKEISKLAEVSVREHNVGLPEEEIQSRAKNIALGAIKYYLLRFSNSVDIHFDPEASISFEGNTGPYCQYAYARACTIMDTAADLDLVDKPDFGLLGNFEERVLAQKMLDFSECVKASAEEMNPAKVANYVFELAQNFSSFYEKHTIILPDDLPLTAARLALVKAMSQILEQCLDLLGIPVLRKM